MIFVVYHLQISQLMQDGEVWFVLHSRLSVLESSGVVSLAMVSGYR